MMSSFSRGKLRVGEENPPEEGVGRQLRETDGLRRSSEMNKAA